MGTFENQLVGFDSLDDRDVIDGPMNVYFPRAFRLHRGEIRDLRHNFDRLPSVPFRGSSEREDGLGDVIADRNRDVFGLHFVRIDHFNGERRRLFAEHSSRVERIRKPVRRHDRFTPVAFQDPKQLLSAAGLRSNSRALTFSHFKLRSRNREITARLHQRTNQRLSWFLILELQLHPFRRADDL